MELLASVHWVAARGARDSVEATGAVHAWNERKKQFTGEQVALAYHRLAEQGWLEGSA
jgi:hypothetical protein